MGRVWELQFGPKEFVKTNSPSNNGISSLLHHTSCVIRTLRAAEHSGLHTRVLDRDFLKVTIGRRDLGMRTTMYWHGPGL
jgi:hypothetical protein